MKKQPFVLAGGLVTVLLLIGAGCSAYNTSNTAATKNQNSVLNGNVATTNENPSASTLNTNSTTSAVSIQNFAFAPADLVVRAGTTVTWTNADSVAHTIIGNTGGPSSSTISPQGTYSYTFSTPGTYAYHCSVHPSMTGSVTVTQ